MVLVVSNHEDARPAADYFGVPFVVTPVTKENKADAEAQQLELLAEHGIDLVVLARYMQILSPEFVERWRGRVINIHHSFLPAFAGARPYHQAKARGVKLIGATAHYATEDLDEGPIIEQDVVRVTHRDEVEDLVRKGRDLERQVLARAVRLHLQRRVPGGRAADDRVRLNAIGISSIVSEEPFPRTSAPCVHFCRRQMRTFPLLAAMQRRTLADRLGKT